jgi:repressor of nif and glnA expression
MKIFKQLANNSSYATRSLKELFLSSLTSLDPSEQYIRARMTSVREAAKTGKGRILANYREIPAPSRTLVAEKMAEMKEAGIGGVYRLGNTSESICQIPVGPNRVGIVFLGGLNALAAVSESGIEVENNSESGVIDFKRLVSFRKI